MKKNCLLILVVAIGVFGQPNKKVVHESDALIFPFSLLIDTTIFNRSITEINNYLPDSISKRLEASDKFEQVYNTNEFTLKIRYREYKKSKPELDLIYIKIPQKTKEYLDSLESKVSKILNTKQNVFKGVNFYQVELKPNDKYTLTFMITWMLDEDSDYYDIDINMGNNKMYENLPD